MGEKQTIYVILNDLEEIIDIKATESEAIDFKKQHHNDYDDYEIEKRQLDLIDQKIAKTLYVVNCEMFAGYDEVSSSLFIKEKDAHDFYVEKIKEFKSDCKEEMQEYPYIEKENNVELENCFIINFSKYTLN